MSNAFTLTRKNVQSIQKSGVIASLGGIVGVLFLIGMLIVLRWVFPSRDFSELEMMVIGVVVSVMTAIGSWLVNFVKVLVEK